jgi:hypothetical protein
MRRLHTDLRDTSHKSSDKIIEARKIRNGFDPAHIESNSLPVLSAGIKLPFLNSANR